MVRKVEISYKTIVFTVFFLFFVGFLYLVKDIILLFFVAVVIMATLNPTVTKLTRIKIPRPIAVLFVYMIFFTILGISIGVIIPILVEQSTSFINNLPSIVNTLGTISGATDLIVKELVSQLGSLPGQIAKITISIFSNIIGVFSVLILAFYLLLAREKLGSQLSFLFGENGKNSVSKFIDSLEVKLGGWARGELILMLTIGLVTYLGLSLIGVPYSLPLAILAGILEIVPTIGPMIAAIPPAIIGFGISPVVGIASIALAFLIQQLENYVLVPRVMQTQAGVSPIVTLLSLAVGFRLAGVVGAIVSVPLFITLQLIIENYLSSSLEAKNN